MAQKLSDEELKKKLTPEQYHVLREKGTEAPGTGKYLNFNEKGMYTCAACGAELFSSDTKHESTMPGLIGWPSFAEAASNDALELRDDDTDRYAPHRSSVQELRQSPGSLVRRSIDADRQALLH